MLLEEFILGGRFSSIDNNACEDDNDEEEDDEEVDGVYSTLLSKSFCSFLLLIFEAFDLEERDTFVELLSISTSPLSTLSLR